MIKLWDNMVIDADERQYIVGEIKTRMAKKNDQTVEEVYIHHPAYCVTITQALQEAFERSVKKLTAENEMSLREAVQRINSIYEKQRNLIEWEE